MLEFKQKYLKTKDLKSKNYKVQNFADATPVQREFRIKKLFLFFF